MGEEVYEPPVCPRCHRANIVVRKDKSILCRRCGFDSKRDTIEA